MHLTTIELTHFRNYASAAFELCDGLNVFWGPNACGKTNLLEAIHILSNLRSFRTHSLRESIRWEASQAYIRGQIETGSPEEGTHSTKTLAVDIQPGGRTFLINAKPCNTSKDYLRTFPSAAFIPDDLDLVKGAPAHRRYFLDKGTFHFYPPYWSLLSEYNKIVRQKNALLRQRQQKAPQRHAAARNSYLTEIWDEHLQETGSKIIAHRLHFVRQIQRLVTQIYQRWVGISEQAYLSYKSNLGIDKATLTQWMEAPDFDVNDVSRQIAAYYERALDQQREREHRLGTAVIGPHRDDLKITLSGRSLRSYGSQGQQRTAVLALKLAEIHLYAELYDEYPILLLDDVSSELDVYRNQGLFESLRKGMQVCITSTEKPQHLSSCALPVQYVELSK